MVAFGKSKDFTADQAQTRLSMLRDLEHVPQAAELSERELVMNLEHIVPRSQEQPRPSAPTQSRPRSPRWSHLRSDSDARSAL